MFANDPISYWIGFHIVIVGVIVCDLALQKYAKGEASRRANLFFVLFVVALATAFGFWLAFARGRQTGLEFASGYLIELSLSIDNLFVFLVIFRSFRLTEEMQRKALFFGILGALVMRGTFIFAGIALLKRFGWLQFVFGALLLLASIRLLREKRPSSDAQNAQRRIPRPEKWIERITGRWRSNPNRVLLSAVLAVEVVDVVFAADSIPAVLAVTHEPMVAYTSNIFAILGLRSLYFLLAGLLERLRFLHFGLAVILGFVGVKMILAQWVHIPILMSLGVILAVVAIATAASLLYRAPQVQHRVKPM